MLHSTARDEATQARDSRRASYRLRLDAAKHRAEVADMLADGAFIAAHGLSMIDRVAQYHEREATCCEDAACEYDRLAGVQQSRAYWAA